MTCRAAAFFAIVLSPVVAHASVAYTAFYHLGESDLGAVAGNLGDSPTIDSSGNGFNLNLHLNNGPTFADYSSNVPPFGSALSMSFSGADYDGGVVTSATNNVGIEAWVYVPSVPVGNAAIVYNGTTGSSGFGLYSKNGVYAVLLGGVGFKTSSTAVVAGTWVNLAFVINGGADTLYINGVAQSLGSTAPLPAVGSMVIGANQAHGENITGNIDEVAVFTFAPGAFSTSNLLYFQEQNAPEPSTNLLTGLGIATLLAVVCFRRSQALQNKAQ
jgi:concanavalin A-like lectin/glucanase superfamily protein